MKTVVFRLGHRVFRDQRMTTHCALVSRAFGSSQMIYSGERDGEMENSIRKVVEKWGGDFEINYEKNWKKIIRRWKGYKILLTMYGINLPDIIEKIRGLKKDLLIIVGGEKVPSDVYDVIDYQVAVTNQPHSEVGALSVFLDWYFHGEELKNEFKNAKVKIKPRLKGKVVVK